MHPLEVELLRFVDRHNDGEPSYVVMVGRWSYGRVVRLRPGCWGAEGLLGEFVTRREAAEALIEKVRAAR